MWAPGLVLVRKCRLDASEREWVEKAGTARCKERDGGTGIGCDAVGSWGQGVGRERWLVLMTPAEHCVKERMSKKA